MLIAVNYHYLRTSFEYPYPGIFGSTPAQLEQQLETLGALGDFVGPADLYAALDGQPLPSRAILIAFDDGLQEQVALALPILRRRGIPAAFFVNTRPVAEVSVLVVHKIHYLRAQIAPAAFLDLMQQTAGPLGIVLPDGFADADVIPQYPYDDLPTARLKYVLNLKLNWQQRGALTDAMFRRVFGDGEADLSRELYLARPQIRELAGLGYLGSHAHDHVPLGLLSPGDMDWQIGHSLDLLETWTGTRPHAMSYPYGNPESCTAAVGRAAAGHGIRFAFTMERAGVRDMPKCPLFLPRFDSNDVPGGRCCATDGAAFFAAVADARWHRN